MHYLRGWYTELGCLGGAEGLKRVHQLELIGGCTRVK